MTAVLIALNIVAGLFLVAVVLLQAGKGADMGAAFGGANPAVFGPTGQGNVLQKVTAATAIVFMGSSLALAVISARQRSVFDGTNEPAPLAAPVAIPGADGNVATGAPAAEGSAPAEGAAANAVAEGSAPEGAGAAVPTAEGGAVAAPASPPASEPAASAPVPVVPPPPAAAPAAPTQPAGQ